MVQFLSSYNSFFFPTYFLGTDDLKLVRNIANPNKMGKFCVDLLSEFSIGRLSSQTQFQGIIFGRALDKMNSVNGA